MKKILFLMLLTFASCKHRPDPQPCVQRFDPAQGLPILPLCN